MTRFNDDGEELEDWEIEEARLDVESRTEIHRDYGSRIPVTEISPAWTGFTVPEWLRINTTDDRKRYK